MSNEELCAMFENDGKDPDEGLTWSSKKSEPAGCLVMDWPHCQKYMDEPWFMAECYLDMTERFIDPAYWIPVNRLKEYADAENAKLYALVSDQGTACPETCLCGKCNTLHNRMHALNLSGKDVTGPWSDVTGNEYCHCIICGAGKPPEEEDER